MLGVSLIEERRDEERLANGQADDANKGAGIGDESAVRDSTRAGHVIAENDTILPAAAWDHIRRVVVVTERRSCSRCCTLWIVILLLVKERGRQALIETLLVEVVRVSRHGTPEGANWHADAVLVDRHLSTLHSIRQRICARGIALLRHETSEPRDVIVHTTRPW